MPIRPENRHRYPANWRQIRERIRARASDRCEACGVPNGAFIYRDDAGQWHEAELRCCADAGEPRVVRIVCTTAHLDHQPENCADENLRFWCQKCHLTYDAPLRAQTARRTRRAPRAVGDLFDEVPW